MSQPPLSDRPLRVDDASTAAAAPRKRRDYRLAAIAVVMLAIAIFGRVVQEIPDGAHQRIIETEPAIQEHPKLTQYERSSTDSERFQYQPSAEPSINPRENPSGHQQEAQQAEIKARFDQAVIMLHAGRFDDAITALHRLLQLAPNMPEAYINMGFSYLGKQEYAMARDFFMGAIDIDPSRANAHYGIAIAYEGIGELESALGGMRGFLHLTDQIDPNQIHVARARSAIWEWESKLGRGPWGPTKGIPPGLTAEQILRVEGKGMGTLVPIAGSEDENGVKQFEIKHSDRIEGIFKP